MGPAILIGIIIVILFISVVNLSKKNSRLNDKLETADKEKSILHEIISHANLLNKPPKDL